MVNQRLPYKIIGVLYQFLEKFKSFPADEVASLLLHMQYPVLNVLKLGFAVISSSVFRIGFRNTDVCEFSPLVELFY